MDRSAVLLYWKKYSILSPKRRFSTAILEIVQYNLRFSFISTVFPKLQCTFSTINIKKGRNWYFTMHKIHYTFKIAIPHRNNLPIIYIQTFLTIYHTTKTLCSTMMLSIVTRFAHTDLMILQFIDR